MTRCTGCPRRCRLWTGCPDPAGRRRAWPASAARCGGLAQGQARPGQAHRHQDGVGTAGPARKLEALQPAGAVDDDGRHTHGAANGLGGFDDTGLMGARASSASGCRRCSQLHGVPSVGEAHGQVCRQNALAAPALALDHCDDGHALTPSGCAVLATGAGLREVAGVRLAWTARTLRENCDRWSMVFTCCNGAAFAECRLPRPCNRPGLRASGPVRQRAVALSA